MKKVDEDFNVEIKELPIDLLVENKGQIPGVPKNPRKISKRRFEELKMSIERSPEMRKLSEVKVYPFNGKYVVPNNQMAVEDIKRVQEVIAGRARNWDIKQSYVKFFRKTLPRRSSENISFRIIMPLVRMI